ncbi:MAG TPA: hypothetical protein IAD08_01490 [Candidatus Scatovivens faecipullorum]|nr:hypothetical protein [Candidatus Scatovivens faecipullorum]
MNNTEYGVAYKEVLEILKYLPKEDYKKIPKSDIKLFETKASKDYYFNYNPDKTLDEQKVSKLAKGIMANLIRDYLVNKKQKEKIISVQKLYREKLEMKKRKKYNTEDIFNNSKKTIELEIEGKANLIEKEKWYEKIFKIFKIFKNILKK